MDDKFSGAEPSDSVPVMFSEMPRMFSNVDGSGPSDLERSLPLPPGHQGREWYWMANNVSTSPQMMAAEVYGGIFPALVFYRIAPLWCVCVHLGGVLSRAEVMDEIADFPDGGVSALNALERVGLIVITGDVVVITSSMVFPGDMVFPGLND